MHDHDEEIDPNLLDEMGYEPRDVNAERVGRSVIVFFIASGIIMIVGMLSMKLLAPQMNGTQFTKVRPRSPEPDVPLLQSNATALQDMHDFVASQRKDLTTYDWTDRKSGHVRIPVQEAMDKVLAQGLPVRAKTVKKEDIE